MQIDLNAKIMDHFVRLEDLAMEAAEDENESFSSRAAAMTAVSHILKELTKTQAEVVNMERLMRVEAVTIETLRMYLTPEQHENFLKKLEEMLDAL